VYEKPSLVRFGSFREVTLGGRERGHFDFAADNIWEFFFTPTPSPTAS
jgi:hypothetical protein